MKKPALIASLFVVSLALGLCLALALPEKATAIYCDIYDFHIYVGDECECHGEIGVEITECQGYTRNPFTGEWEDCVCYTYCTACPPPGKKGPWPKMD
jgi:hypothetical protein